MVHSIIFIPQIRVFASNIHRLHFKGGLLLISLVYVVNILMKIKITFIWLVTFILVITGCNDNDEKIRFEGIILTDDTGASLGTKGSTDLNDWQQDDKLPDEVLAMMDVQHGEDLSDTDYALLEIVGFPNPCNETARVNFVITGGPCLLKIVVVNEQLQMLYRSVKLVTGDNHVFDFSDQGKFPDQSIVRVYYSFSTEEDPDFYVGHGDFWICRSGNCN
jgi:hypothetical protein